MGWVRSCVPPENGMRGDGIVKRDAMIRFDTINGIRLVTLCWHAKVYVGVVTCLNFMAKVHLSVCINVHDHEPFVDR